MLDVEINGSGDVDVADGRVDGQSVRITGSGDYYARRVEGADADVRVAGSGSVTLQASEYLEETGAGEKYVLIFSDLEEDLQKGHIRDFPISLPDIHVVALNVTKLRTDRVMGKFLIWPFFRSSSRSENTKIYFSPAPVSFRYSAA